MSASRSSRIAERISTKFNIGEFCSNFGYNRKIYMKPCMCLCVYLCPNLLNIHRREKCFQQKLPGIADKYYNMTLKLILYNGHVCLIFVLMWTVNGLCWYSVAFLSTGLQAGIYRNNVRYHKLLWLRFKPLCSVTLSEISETPSSWANEQIVMLSPKVTTRI